MDVFIDLIFFCGFHLKPNIAGAKTEDESDISFLKSADSTLILSCLTDSPDAKRIEKTYSHTLLNGEIQILSKYFKVVSNIS